MKTEKITYDKYQQLAIKCLDNCLLIAGAGTGKTTTIVGKINYLIKNNIYKVEDILVISFTNQSTLDLQSKITEPVAIKTFHKLAIQIIKDYNQSYKLTTINLNYITKEFFFSLTNPSLIKEILNYYHEANYQTFLNSSKYYYLQQTIITYISLYKTNLGSKLDLNNIAKENPFLTKLIIIIFNIYEQELKATDTVDFDDLILKATNLLDKPYKYKLIIIDEFQDTSFLRFNLVQKLLKLNQAKIFAVGDDYQSIYHFSGCNIDLFLNFTTYIPDAKIYKLKTTYRNSQELLNIATKFILKNPNQISKQLTSLKHLSKPIIIKYYLNKNKALEKLLKKLVLKYPDILILGRYQKDIEPFLTKNIYFKNKILYYQNKELRYLTIHSSKGLESDVVILLNLTNTILGFPSLIKPNSLLDSLNKSNDNFQYAEERRLFYVALTRTKNEIYLLTPISHKSIFIKELYRINMNNH